MGKPDGFWICIEFDMIHKALINLSLGFIQTYESDVKGGCRIKEKCHCLNVSEES